MNKDDTQTIKDKEKGLGAKIVDKAKEMIGGGDDKSRAGGSSDYSNSGADNSSWNPRMDEDYDRYDE